MSRLLNEHIISGVITASSQGDEATFREYATSQLQKVIAHKITTRHGVYRREDFSQSLRLEVVVLTVDELYRIADELAMRPTPYSTCHLSEPIP